MKEKRATQNRKIDLMHDLFGIADGICRDCNHLCKYTANRTWYKCEIYGKTSSEASDWRLKWQACGLKGLPKPESMRPVIEHSRKNVKEDIQIDGQMSLF